MSCFSFLISEKLIMIILNFIGKRLIVCVNFLCDLAGVITDAVTEMKVAEQQSMLKRRIAMIHSCSLSLTLRSTLAEPVVLIPSSSLQKSNWIN